MTNRSALFVCAALIVLLVAAPVSAAETAAISGILSNKTVAPNTPVTFVVSVPGNATQVQEWTLACYKVTGVMSVPASCGADVAVKNVRADPLVLDNLPTADEGTYTVIAAFPGPDGTFGIGYDKTSRTLYYAANHTVIANWSRDNPSDREEAAAITKSLESPGIENPSVSGSYTVTGSVKTAAGATEVVGQSPTVTKETSVPETTAAPARTTSAPGFGGVFALAGLVAAAFACTWLRH
ncbi:MAG: PGF-CTERM sorting domain-containing protein [Methanoregula sp.]|nr:PGF-CTERM sorting domain-containing protein [Methanoregula sp.]